MPIKFPESLCRNPLTNQYQKNLWSMRKTQTFDSTRFYLFYFSPLFTASHNMWCFENKLPLQLDDEILISIGIKMKFASSQIWKINLWWWELGAGALLSQFCNDLRAFLVCKNIHCTPIAWVFASFVKGSANIGGFGKNRC